MDEVVIRIEDERRRRETEEFANAFRSRKGCRHRLIRDEKFVAGLVSVIEQLPVKDIR